jgi:two-component system NtrC family response regulator
VITLRLPPLRERPEDISFLAQYFLDRYSSELGRGRFSLTPGAKLAMQHHPWTGNVRELEHRVQKAVLMSGSRMLEEEDLEIEAVKCPKRMSLRQARHEADRKTIGDALRLTGGNVSRAAELLGISRPSLHELLRKLGVNVRDYKRSAAREQA